MAWWPKRQHQVTELSQTLRQKSHALIYFKTFCRVLISLPANRQIVIGRAYHNKSLMRLEISVPRHPKIRGIRDNGPPTSIQGWSKAQQALCWLCQHLTASFTDRRLLSGQNMLGILQLQDATVSVRRLIHPGQGGTWDVGGLGWNMHAETLIETLKWYALINPTYENVFANHEARFSEAELWSVRTGSAASPRTKVTIQYSAAMYYSRHEARSKPQRVGKTKNYVCTGMRRDLLEAYLPLFRR